MAVIKLISKGFNNYTGPIGHFLFKDGISEEMSMADAERIAAAIQVRIVEDGVVTDKNPSPAQRLIDIKSQSIIPKEQKTDTKSVEPPKPVEKKELPYDYTQESLEKLADDGGIKALRAVADLYDVRGTAVAGIVKDLMSKKAFAAPVETKENSVATPEPENSVATPEPENQTNPV